MKIRIMTYNVQSFKDFKTGKINYENIVKIIKKYKPDVLGLNEVFDKGYDKNSNISQVEELNKKLGYNYCFSKATKIRGINYGNAFLSKDSIEDVEIIKVHQPIFRTSKRLYQRRSILKLETYGCTFIFTHLGLNLDEQKNGIKKLLLNISDNKCILMGDLNMEENNYLIKTVENKLYNTSNSSKKELLTYPSDKPNRKLDYIFVSKDIKVSRVFVPKVIASDHRPYIVDIIL